MSNDRRRAPKESDTTAENDIDSDTIADRIRALREARGQSVDQLARAARLKPAFINAIEDGKLEPLLSDLHKIARGLNVPLRELFGAETPRALVLATAFNQAPEELQSAIATILASSWRKK